MASEAGGDPTQGSLARGDPELHVDAVNQELRDELAEKCGNLIISKCMLLECEVRNNPLAIVRRHGRLFSIRMNVSMKQLNISSKLPQM